MLDKAAMHRSIRRALSLLGLTVAVAGCSQAPGEISRDTQPFDGIVPSSSISVTGTEPFWSIAIEPDGEAYVATYSSPENLEGTRFVASRFAGNNGVGFSGELEGEAVQIALTPGDCSDGMSDRTYPYIAMVAIGARDLRGCAYTSDEPFSGAEAP